jgi:hypothetical protein
MAVPDPSRFGAVAQEDTQPRGHPDRPPEAVAAHRAVGQLLSGECREHLPGGAEDREVPVAGVELELRARYHLGV